MDEEWLAARRIPGRLGWPHQWKQRAAAYTAAAPENDGTETDRGSAATPATARGESRKRLRRAHARPDEFSYDESARKRQRRTETADERQGQRKRRIAYMDHDDGRGRELRRMIRIGPETITAMEGGGARGGEAG